MPKCDMKSLVYYNPNVITKQGIDQPGINNFSHFFRMFNDTVAMVDRSGVIKSPINTTSLFPIPTIPANFNKTFEQICDERAIELLERAEKLDVPLSVFYSGGIDSTLLMVSLLKQATPAQKKRIVVLLTNASINENPNFYEDHIRNKLTVDSATMFPYALNRQSMVVGGEHNDQLFGSDVIRRLIVAHGIGVLHQPYNRDLFTPFFIGPTPNPVAMNMWIDLFEKSASQAPIPIRSNFEFLWWLNFSMKWQSVFMRVLSYTPKRNLNQVDPSFVRVNYDHFYTTDEFQIWSMLNQDLKIRDSWNSYKWPCKDIIYNFTKDADYRDNKTKQGSLYHLLVQQLSYNFIDTNMDMAYEMNFEDYYVPNNDFI